MIDNNIFYNSFYFNFLSSFIFLSIILLCSLYTQNSKNLVFKNSNPHLIFSFIFAIYSLFLNLFILFKIINFFYIFFYLFTFLLTLLVIFFFKKDKFLLNKKNENDNYYFYFFLFLFFLLSILPISDADSIALHLKIPYQIYFENLSTNLSKDIENMLFSSTESLLTLSFILKSDNFGAQLNFFSLLIFFYSFRKNKYFFYILFCSPLIIYFITAQKLQLFFGLLFLSLFISIYENKIKSNFDLFIFIFLLVFYSTGKLTYIVFSIFLFIFFIFKNKNNLAKSILFLSLALLFLQLPLLIYKFLLFNNPIAPLFDNFINQREIFNAFAYSIRSSEGWIDNFSVSLFFRPFFTTDLSKLSTIFGVCFLLMLLDFKNIKKLYFIPYLIILAILISGQILPRYYLESFLILAFYANYKIYYKFINIIQGFFIISFAITFIGFSYQKIFLDHGFKKLFMNKYSYSFQNSQELYKKKIPGNVLVTSFDRPSIFFKNNVYSMRSLNILNQFNKKNKENLISFIKTNNIKFVIHNSFKDFPSCLKIISFDEIYFKVATRNFLVKDNLDKYQIGEIIKNEC